MTKGLTVEQFNKSLEKHIGRQQLETYYDVNEILVIAVKRMTPIQRWKVLKEFQQTRKK